MIELDEQLREAGERWRAAERPPVADFDRATAGPRRSGPRRRAGVLVGAAVAVTALVTTSAVLVFGGGDSSPQKVVVTQPTAPPTASEPPSELILDPGIVQTQALAIDGSTVWVTGDAPANGAATLEQIDTRTGTVLQNVVLGDNLPFQIVVGDGAIWVASQQNEDSAHVTKVDPTTGKITAVIGTAADTAVAVTPGAVWFDVGTGELQRRDPTTNNVLATITLPGADYSAHFITTGPLGIFLSNPYDGTVLRVDPATNTVHQIADIGDSAGELVELDGSLWINANTFIVQVDPVTGAIERRIQRTALGLVTDGRSLWASTRGHSLLRIDPRTGGETSVPLAQGLRYAIDLTGDPTTGAVWASEVPLPVGEGQLQRLLRVAP